VLRPFTHALKSAGVKGRPSAADRAALFPVIRLSFRRIAFCASVKGVIAAGTTVVEVVRPGTVAEAEGAPAVVDDLETVGAPAVVEVTDGFGVTDEDEE